MRKRSHKERGLYEDLRALSFQKFSPPKALGALSSHRPIEYQEGDIFGGAVLLNFKVGDGLATHVLHFFQIFFVGDTSATCSELRRLFADASPMQ